MRRLFALTLLLLHVVAGCSRPAPATPAAPAGPAQTLTVAAASDLQGAFTDLGKRFAERTGIQVTFTFGSTGTLAKQIENGAPIDLLAAAAIDYVDGLKQKGLVIPETEQVYALGHIVLATAKSTGPALTDLKQLTGPSIKKIAIANPDTAPYGLAAKQALQSAGLWEQLQPKLVYGENIRQTLQFIQTGNADAGIVALSIASVPEIGFTPISPALHAPLKQALAVVKGSKHEQAARQFAAYVTGPDGWPVLQKYGFAPPEGP
ncbi:MAG TPA: molybdate ABC transporter substrate-binding protein [Symbiobacteriaceae bacterium]